MVGAELATNPEARDRARDDVTRVSGAMVEGMDALLRDAEARIELPREFVVPGETRLSAALELARTILRRAERRAVTLSLHDQGLAGSRLLTYLNRLADLLWVLARDAEQAEAHVATVARPDRRRGLAGGIDLTRKEPRMSGTPYSPNTPATPSQLGVRPAPALVQKLLVGAFGWMFAGLLLSAGVAYLVGSSFGLYRLVTQWWFLIFIAPDRRWPS